MDSLYIFLTIAVILVIGGIIWYFVLKASKKDLADKPAAEKIPAKRSPGPLPPSRQPAAADLKKATPEKAPVPLPSSPDKVIILRKDLMNRIGGVQRIYDSNIEIARKDLARKGNQNPSELELLERAIELLGIDKGWRR